jgi:hypothetical protein
LEATVSLVGVLAAIRAGLHLGLVAGRVLVLWWLAHTGPYPSDRAPMPPGPTSRTWSGKRPAHEDAFDAHHRVRMRDA